MGELKSNTILITELLNQVTLKAGSSPLNAFGMKSNILSDKVTRTHIN